MTEVFNNGNYGKPSFTFVVATQMSEADWRNGKKELPLLQSLSKITLDEVNVRVWVFFDNHDGLQASYNRAIDEICRAEIEKNSFICFVHDDITLNDCFFFDKIIGSKFDVIGPVGGCYWGVPPGFDVEHKPLIWTVATCGKGASGFMNHDLASSGHLGTYLPSSYGPSPLPTVSLDGCCLILNQIALERGLRFDSEFDRFDFYDHALVQSAISLGLKVGTAPILCTHGSVGAGVLSHTEEFLKYQKMFIEKYFIAKLG